jgi:hypothetical protein
MRVEADIGQLAARNAMMPAKPETAIEREPDSDKDDVKKAALQPAQRTQQINPTDEETGTKVNLLA